MLRVGKVLRLRIDTKILANPRASESQVPKPEFRGPIWSERILKQKQHEFESMRDLLHAASSSKQTDEYLEAYQKYQLMRDELKLISNDDYYRTL